MTNGRPFTYSLEPFIALKWRSEARLQQALGRPREAATLYDEFLALWRESDPELKPMPDQATAGRASLSERTQ